MHPSVRFVATSLVAAACLWPVAASAQSADSGPQVDQVRKAFSDAGYQVDAPLSWDWLRPPVSSIRVHDAARDRVLLVLVYPSTTAALAGRLQAEAHEQALDVSQPLPSGTGPHLVVGFGPSTWRGNVALVQTTETELTRAYRAQEDRDNGVDRDPVSEAAPVGVAVALDFLQALDASVVNL